MVNGTSAPSAAAKEGEVLALHGAAERAARRAGCSEEQALDVAQEAVVRILARGSLGAVGPGYAARVGRSVACDEGRRRQIAGRHWTRLAATLDPFPGPAQLLQEREGQEDHRRRLAALRTAVEGLPPLLRPIIQAELKGLSRSETAARLGLSIPAVRMRAYRARRWLEVRLSGSKGPAAAGRGPGPRPGRRRGPGTDAPPVGGGMLDQAWADATRADRVWCEDGGFERWKPTDMQLGARVLLRCTCCGRLADDPEPRCFPLVSDLTHDEVAVARVIPDAAAAARLETLRRESRGETEESCA